MLPTKNSKSKISIFITTN